MNTLALVYGTAWKKERTADLVELALSTGFRGIDTACQPRHYNEVGVGEGLSRAYGSGHKREKIFIQSKYTPEDGQDPETIPYDPRASYAEQVQTSLKVSLKNLRTDYLDSWVLHSPLSSWKDLTDVWGAMSQAVEDGRVKQIGISNCYDYDLFVRLFNYAEVKPRVLQNRFYRKSGFDVGLREFCRENNVVYQSFWTLTANPELLLSETMTVLSQKYHRTPVQILFRALHQLGVQPLTGTTSKDHMQEDLQIETFVLENGDLQSLRALGPF